jgi:hypothetical protein
VITSVTNATVGEKTTTFTSKEITMMAATWPETWEDLASVLDVDIAVPNGEEATDVESCSVVLQEWLKQNCGDRRTKLTKKFEEKDCCSMAEEITKLHESAM